MYKSIRSVVHDNYEDNLFSTIVVHDNNDGSDTGLLDQNGNRIYSFPDKIKMGYDTSVSTRRFKW